MISTDPGACRSINMPSHGPWRSPAGRVSAQVMKVTWGTSPDHNGHLTSNGCFRCHDDTHMAKDGSTISGECEFCHTRASRRPSGPRTRATRSVLRATAPDVPECARGIRRAP